MRTSFEIATEVIIEIEIEIEIQRRLSDSASDAEVHMRCTCGAHAVHMRCTWPGSALVQEVNVQTSVLTCSSRSAFWCSSQALSNASKGVAFARPIASINLVASGLI